MRLQIPAHSPLALLTLVSACGGAQGADTPSLVTLTSLQCDGDPLPAMVVEALLEQGYVNTSHRQTDERSHEWLQQARDGLNRLARRLTPPPGSGFSSDHERTGLILAVADSELTESVELLLLTGWNESPTTPFDAPDPLGIIGHSAAVLQCTAAGLWEPVAHHDLELPHSYLNMVGIRTSNTAQGLIHTLILQDIDPYMYDQSVFDFAIVVGNERSRSQPDETGPYAYEDSSSDWGPLSWLGELYSIGYDIGYHAGTYTASVDLLDSSDWFPLNGVDADPTSYDYSAYSWAFLALQYRAYFEDIYDAYEGYYDDDYSDDNAPAEFGILGALTNQLGVSGYGLTELFDGGYGNIDSLYEGIMGTGYGGLLLEEDDDDYQGVGTIGAIGTTGRGSGSSSPVIGEPGDSSAVEHAPIEDPAPSELADEYIVDELYLEYLTNLPEMQAPVGYDGSSSVMVELLAAEDDDVLLLSSELNATRSRAPQTGMISMTAAAGLGADRFTGFAPALLPSFVLLVRYAPESMCRLPDIECRTLSSADQERLATTELAATAVVGAWISWQQAAATAEELGLGHDDYLILGPDPLSDQQYWTAYFGDADAEWANRPEELNRLASESHPRLRAYVFSRPGSEPEH